MFINREAELAQLEHLYASNKTELFVLYGRRRVGKTELLRAFCKDKPHIFFISTLSSDSDQLASFSQLVWGYMHQNIPQGFTFPSWETAFRALAELPSEEKRGKASRPIIILDEFTYLISGNKAIPSILQKVWDETLRTTNIVLILCSSYMGMMETEVLGYHAPLYGRRTASALLQPLDLPSSALFFPDYSPEEKIKTWAVIGGMPYYLRTFTEKQDLLSNIRRHILDPQEGSLYNEPRLLLMEELREPRNYFSILRAIAQGKTRLSEITQASGVGPAHATSRYLDILQQMRLVTRRVPVTETQPEKSKKGIYQINDHFLRFWFRYVHPNQGSIDLGLADAILEQRVRPTLDRFVAATFEEASQAYVAQLARKSQMPFLPERIGSWWDRETEIDLVAVSDSEKALMVGECKWSINPVGLDILDGLKSKSQLLNKARDWQNVYFALFSRSGFTPALADRAQKEGILLVGSGNMIDSEVG